jgi:N-acetylglucosaminyldiphosphoundecaprenol N-acetyl-beta-D-mannosaminyltransferase
VVRADEKLYRDSSIVVEANLKSVAPEQSKPLGVLGTPLRATTYAAFTAELQSLARQRRTIAVDFTNTQIATLRRHERTFREVTQRFDYFVPDGMPLIWCLNAQGANLRDRVYGPTFMRHCVLASPAPFTHYLLGGSTECLRQLQAVFLKQNPSVQIVGSRNGYFGPVQEQEIVEEIVRLSPDFIWVGLGTPKQQAWIDRYRDVIPRGILLAVGFAFDVNAGTKPDAPLWMQRLGLTWAFRIISEPRRLGPRYLKYNFLFLFYVLWDGLRGRAWSTGVDRPTQA